MTIEEKLLAIRRLVQEWEVQLEEDDEVGNSVNPFYLIEDLYTILNA